jgi:hypothetical protein
VVAPIPPAGLAGGRISTQGGNFFAGVPAGADIYLLIRVLHDWADEDALSILRSCRAAMGSDGRSLIVEQILQPDPSRGRQTDYLVDLQMMAMFGSARERTEAEFRVLLTPAGFELLRVIATASPVFILEAASR